MSRALRYILCLAFIVLIVLLATNNNWKKIAFYITNQNPVVFYNIKFNYNFGMSFKKMENTLVLSRIGKIGSGDIVIIANATYRCEKDIADYYKSSDKNELISYNATTFKKIPAINVEYYALPARTYMRSIFVISKNIIIGYSGPKSDEHYFQQVIDSLEFINNNG